MADHETLGENVIPSKYTLSFSPNLKTFIYGGNASISVQIKKPTRSITLNASELKISGASVYSSKREQKASVTSDAKLQRITLSFKDPVSGKAEISIAFTGIHNDKMYGFYRSRVASSGKAGYMLSSQFEAANARNAFPCFDEPSFKAVFEVSMTVDKGLECISNMPISKVKGLEKGMKEVRFLPTPIMSTYLLYLGVGKYDHVDGNAGSTKVRVVTTPGNAKLAKLPLKYAIDAILFYEKYFGIKYPVPKVDFIAVPDFAAGAMENWGAITFRETALLIDEDSSVAAKQRVAEVIAHELTHQWFGDLVTMKWWNDLWLNESFATFMSYKAMDHSFPEWKVKTEYLRDVIATAFGADQLKSTHPIRVHVESPEQIDQIFDEISYEKGGTVLNMIEHYAGEETFRKGLNVYLKKHSYSNATTSDLWEAIDQAAKSDRKKIDVKRVANYWISKPGYPIVGVEKSKGGFMLSQERYFLLSEMYDKTVWPIPINYSLSGRKGQILMEGKTAQIRTSDNEWIKLNYGQSGLYRVAYEEDNLERLGELVSSKEIDAMDAWGLENDMFARARSGRIVADDYLEFAESYCLDSGYPLNINVLGHVGWIYDMLYGHDNADAKDLLVRYSSQIIDQLGWVRKENESSFDTTIRASAILEAGLADHQPTIDKATALFNDYVKKGKEIDPNIRGPVYYVNVWNHGRSAYEILRKRYEKEEVPEERSRLLHALAMPKDPGLIRDALAYSLTDKVRLQDAYAIPAIISSSPEGREIVWSWTKENWQRLKKMYASGTHMLGRYVSNTGGLSDMAYKEEIEKFFSRKENRRNDITQNLGKALEQIEANSIFVKANTKG